jgi:hypothetical protein
MDDTQQLGASHDGNTHTHGKSRSASEQHDCQYAHQRRVTRKTTPGVPQHRFLARKGQVWENEDEQALLLLRRICPSANLEIIGPAMFPNRSSGPAMSQFARMLRRGVPADWNKNDNNVLLRLYV